MTATEELETCGLCAHGRQIVLRALRREDSEALGSLSDAVSEHSIYLRFFSANRESARRYYSALCQRTRLGGGSIIACDQDRIIGVACFEPLTPTSAEIALLVDDPLQGCGIGTLLLERLMSQARSGGVETFVANVLTENHAMLSVLHHFGFRTDRAFDSVELRLTWDHWPESADRVGPFGGADGVFGPET